MRAVLKTAGRILKWLITALLSLLLIANLYTVIARQITGEPQPSIFGWSSAVVISGSMEPDISVNDLIIVHKQSTYEVGDVITFKSNNSVVTHRVIEKNDGYYTTKGDANNTQDDPVSSEMVIGKVTATIPKLGLVIGYFRTPVGMICLILIGLLTVEIPYLIDRFKKEKGGCD